jgi:hypothetical protein
MIMLIQLSFALGILLKILNVSDIAFEGTTGDDDFPICNEQSREKTSPLERL